MSLLISNKFRELFSLKEKEKLPVIGDYFTELHDKAKMTDDGLKELLYFLADRKYKEAINLDFLDKQFILQHIQDNIKRIKGCILDRKSFNKQIKDAALLLERDLYLDLNELAYFQSSGREKFRLSLLRKYGPTRQSQIDTPSRSEFMDNLKAEQFKECSQIIICMNIRRIAYLKNMDKENMAKIIYRVLTKAKNKKLDIGMLSTYCKQESKALPAAAKNDNSYQDSLIRSSINYTPVRRS